MRYKLKTKRPAECHTTQHDARGPSRTGRIGPQLMISNRRRPLGRDTCGETASGHTPTSPHGLIDLGASGAPWKEKILPAIRADEPLAGSEKPARRSDGGKITDPARCRRSVQDTLWPAQCTTAAATTKRWGQARGASEKTRRRTRGNASATPGHPLGVQAEAISIAAGCERETSGGLGLRNKAKNKPPAARRPGLTLG
jgi:hypothetical protein